MSMAIATVDEVPVARKIADIVDCLLSFFVHLPDHKTRGFQ